MMTLSSRAVATAFASVLLMSSAFAQTAAPAPAPAAAPAAKMDKKPVMHSAASVECSKEADAKGLHGKERKKFRSECKMEAKGKDAAAPATK
jgi:psiF repeat